MYKIWLARLTLARVIQALRPLQPRAGSPIALLLSASLPRTSFEKHPEQLLRFPRAGSFCPSGRARRFVADPRALLLHAVSSVAREVPGHVGYIPEQLGVPGSFGVGHPRLRRGG